MASAVTQGPAAEIRTAATLVIQQKLEVPPLSETRVARPRVESRLAELIETHRVVAVLATAGAGKTTAVAAAAELLDRPIAWLTLDTPDVAQGRLLTYLEASLARVAPQVGGVVAHALSAGLGHVEAAGLLADALGEQQVVLVLDDMERLGEAREPWELIDSLLRHGHSSLRAVLISRRDVPHGLSALRPSTGAMAAIGDEDLTFTAGEAAEALAEVGKGEADAASAVEATGGWVTGVLFEAWRSAEHVPGMGGEADPLHGYLSAQMLAELRPEDRDFLIETAVLHDVSPARAAAIGRADAGERLASLRAAHLPVAWATGEHDDALPPALPRVPHRPAGAAAARAGPGAAPGPRPAAGRGGPARGGDGGAAARRRARARRSAARAARSSPSSSGVDYSDRRALDRDARARRAQPAPTTGWRPSCCSGSRSSSTRAASRSATACSSAASGRRSRPSSERAAALMGWNYLDAARIEDFKAVLAVAPEGPALAAVKYRAWLTYNVEPGQKPVAPPRTGGPFDSAILIADYLLGRLEDLPESGGSALGAGSRDAVADRDAPGARPDAAGDRALRGGDAVAVGAALADADHLHRPGAAGRRRPPRRGPRRRRRGAPRGAGGRLAEPARPELFRGGEAGAAAGEGSGAGAGRARPRRASPQRPPDRLGGRDVRHALRAGPAAPGPRRARARRGCARAVAAMRAGDRILELPTAAVYLAEAEWRAGNEDAADRAADIALEAAQRQGSNHILMQALADLPAVLSRRIDSEPSADSIWHQLGRALIAQGVRLTANPGASIHFSDFGERSLEVDGELRPPKISKSYELLAYLMTHGEATREGLLGALFKGRADNSARAYLRQAINGLRECLPERALVAPQGGSVALADDVLIVSDSERLESRLIEAARLQGRDRVAATLDALTLSRAGRVPRGDALGLGRRSPRAPVRARPRRAARRGRARARGGRSRAGAAAGPRGARGRPLPRGRLAPDDAPRRRCSATPTA